MRLTKYGIVLCFKDGQVCVTTGPASADDYWVRIEDTIPPKVGSKVMLVFDKQNQIWEMARGSEVQGRR
jgi:hypothetical protein